MSSPQSASQSARPHSTPLPRNPLRSQLIVSAVALTIIGLGSWSMIEEKSPYHPDGVSGEVTRAGPSALSSFIASD